MLYGYGSQIWAGTLATCLLTLLTLVFSIIIGMIGALCKLSPNPVLRWTFTGYTTLIRSVPDLVIMLLVFYNLQVLINTICAWGRLATISDGCVFRRGHHRSRSSMAPI